MQHVRKMALVPEQLVQKIFEKERDDAELFSSAPVKPIASLDEQLKSLLARNDLPADLKAKEYQNVLQRYTTIRDKHIGRTTAPQAEQDTAPFDITHGVPARYAARAKELFEIVQTTPDLKWTDKGEMIYNGQQIQGSNITDLIRTYAKPGQRGAERPRGWKEFGQALVAMNVPRTSITNKLLWNEVERPVNVRNREPSPDVDIPAAMFETPPPPQRRARTVINRQHWTPYHQRTRYGQRNP